METTCKHCGNWITGVDGVWRHAPGYQQCADANVTYAEPEMAVDLLAALKARHTRLPRPSISGCTCGLIICPDMIALEAWESGSASGVSCKLVDTANGRQAWDVRMMCSSRACGFHNSPPKEAESTVKLEIVFEGTTAEVVSLFESRISARLVGRSV